MSLQQLPVGCSCWGRYLSAPARELFSSHTEKLIGSNWLANHLALSPTWAGSNTPVCTRRKATLLGVSDHSARNSTACLNQSKQILKYSLESKCNKWRWNYTQFKNNQWEKLINWIAGHIGRVKKYMIYCNNLKLRIQI